MTWITDRNPTRDELRVTFQRTGYTGYGGTFLVSIDGVVSLGAFAMPPNGNDWYPGYWRSVDRVDGWMPLPAPVVVAEAAK